MTVLLDTSDRLGNDSNREDRWITPDLVIVNSIGEPDEMPETEEDEFDEEDFDDDFDDDFEEEIEDDEFEIADPFELDD